jgi:hypothetical protein
MSSNSTMNTFIPLPMEEVSTSDALLHLSPSQKNQDPADHVDDVTRSILGQLAPTNNESLPNKG